MKKGLVVIIALSLLCSTLPVFGAIAERTTLERGDEYSDLSTNTIRESRTTGLLGDPQIEITYPEPGYLYLFSLRPIKMPISSALGLGHAVVIGRGLNIDTISSEIHHAKFVAKRVFAGWETVRWDYNTIDGLSMDLGLSTGIYEISVYAYDEGENELGSDLIKVFFIKLGGDDFGIWVNTKYDNGQEFSAPADIGLLEFGSMLTTGESKIFSATLQSEDDTTVEMRFTRKEIMNFSENVIETKFDVETTCDTTKDYEVSLELRFPFTILDGGEPSEPNDPYFSAQVGYKSYAEGDEGPNKVNTTFYFGRESIEDPRIFRLKLKPDTLESDTQLTFFSRYRTIDGSGNEVFYREFAVEFEPATELTITTIPSELKIRYDFGESAGVPTKISFQARGGPLDDISQTFEIDPLPAYMSFDLTVIGGREFIYESDRTYDVTYSLDSEQDGNLVTFEVVQLPATIHATWGFDLGQLGDLNVSSFVDLDMSHEVERLALYFLGNEIPFVELDHFTRKLSIYNYIDVLSGTGNITIIRGIQEEREMNISVMLDVVRVTKTFELINNFVQFTWDIGLIGGHGNIEISRDSESTMTLSTSIFYNDWTFTKSVVLKNSYIQLAWDVDREERQGNIVFQRDSEGGDTSVSFSLSHDTWTIVDTLELKNEYIELYWDLPNDGSTHAEIGLNTNGDKLFYNTISVVDDTYELLSFGVGIKTEDHFYVSWENNGGQISNFEWSGRILNLSDLDLSVHLPGDLFTISGTWNIGESGAFNVELNKPVTITFADVESDRFKIDGYISFYSDRRLDVSWKLQEEGYFRITTNGEPLGEEASFSVLWDPNHQSNYKYGFMITAPDFLETNLNISYTTELTFPHIWIAGELPDNWLQWEKWLLWNYEWYDIGLA